MAGELMEDGTKCRIISWNTGLRGWHKVVKDFGSLEALLEALQADILCIQEVKSSYAELQEYACFAEGCTSYFSFPLKGSKYAGVATIARDEWRPIDAEEGITGLLRKSDKDGGSSEVASSSPVPSSIASGHSFTSLQLDSEGRCIITDHKEFILFNVYFPAHGCEEHRSSFKAQFHYAVTERARHFLTQGREVIIVGDYNVSHRRIDHCDPKEWEVTVGRPFEVSTFRRWMDHFLGIPPSPKGSEEAQALGDPLPFVDTFRMVHPSRKGAFSCWNSVTSARETNYGTRLDYVCLSSGLLKTAKVVDADVHQDIYGSDHCPVSCTLHFPTRPLRAVSGATLHAPPALCSLFNAAMLKRQTSLKQFVQKGQRVSPVPFPSATEESRSLPAASPSPEPNAAAAATRGKGQGGAKQREQGSLLQFFGKRSAATQGVTAAAAGEGPEPRKRARVPNTPVEASSSSLVTTELTVEEHELLTVVKQNAKAQIAKSSASWGQLLTGPVPPPQCAHGEPTVERTVLKPGMNLGKKFYVCRRPAGLKTDPNARCNFFMWASDHRDRLKSKKSK